MLIAPPARREPTHNALARAEERERYAQDDRSQRALVSIHVEVSQPELDADPIEAQILDAQVVEAEGEAVPPAAWDRAPPRLTPFGQDAMYALEQGDGAPQNALNAHAAERGFGIYAAQRSLASTQSSHAAGLLDVRA